MVFAITGEKGFIGMHLTCHIKNVLKHEIVELTRDFLQVLPTTRDIDWLIIGACVHRHAFPEMIYEQNKHLYDETLRCIQEHSLTCNIIFLSSIQEEFNTPYGRSKRYGDKLFRDFSSRTNRKYISFKLPNIFGSFARPNHTSFVATFCYNIHNKLPVFYNTNSVKLASVNSVVEVIAALQQDTIPYKCVTVDEIYFKLIEFNKSLKSESFPIIENLFDFDLYQTFLHYKNYKI